MIITTLLLDCLECNLRRNNRTDRRQLRNDKRETHARAFASCLNTGCTCEYALAYFSMWVAMLTQTHTPTHTHTHTHTHARARARLFSVNSYVHTQADDERTMEVMAVFFKVSFFIFMQSIIYSFIIFLKYLLTILILKIFF